MREVVIVEAGRSPIGKRGGSLSTAHPTDVLGPVQMEVLRRAGVDPGAVGQVVGGCINKVGAQAMNVTRTAWLSHGGPEHVAATTVDSQCGSSQYAVNLAYSLIASGAEDVVLACGVENMSRLPIGSDAVAGAKAGLRQAGRPAATSATTSSPASSRAPSASPTSTASPATAPTPSASAPRSGRPGPSPRAASRPRSSPLEVDVVDEDGARTGERRPSTRDEIPRETSLEKLAAAEAGGPPRRRPHRRLVLPDRRRCRRRAADVGRGRRGRRRPSAGPGQPHRAGRLRPGADARRPDPRHPQAARRAKGSTSTTSTCSRSTRRSRRSCWPGRRSSARTWTGSTPTAAPSRWATRSVAPAASW